MRNLCVKKGLVIGIIVLFLGVTLTPLVSAFNLKSSDGEYRETDDTMICQNDEKPDLIIVDVKDVYVSNGYPYLLVSIKNIGQADAIWNGATRLRCIYKNRKIGTFTEEWSGNEKHAAGTTKTTRIWFGDSGFWVGAPAGFWRLYFEVDYSKLIDEENEENNGVWMYSFILCFMVYTGWMGVIELGRLRPWNPDDGFVNPVNHLSTLDYRGTGNE